MIYARIHRDDSIKNARKAVCIKLDQDRLHKKTGPWKTVGNKGGSNKEPDSLESIRSSLNPQPFAAKGGERLTIQKG
jgi:hypothetical protein